MTVGIKIDVLPAIKKSSSFSLFYPAALNMPASEFDGSTFPALRECLYRHHSLREASAPSSFSNPRPHPA
jgi:hypothetical protein